MAIDREYQLMTQRCILRHVSEQDIPHVFAATRFEGFNDGMTWEPPQEEADLLVSYRRNCDAWRAGTGCDLYIDGDPVLVATQDYLSRRGIFAHEHASLVCSDPNPCFEFGKPTVALIRWNSAPVVNRILRWVDGADRGEMESRRIDTRFEFVGGATVGPEQVGR